MCYTVERVKSMPEKKKCPYKNPNYMRDYIVDYYLAKPWMKTLKAVRQRCNYKKRDNYYRYGGRGVRNFLTPQNMENLWFRDNAESLKNPSIDRIDTNGDYTFGNCRFIELLDNIGRFYREKTHCKQGHEFTKENTHYYKWRHLIKRSCKTCLRAWSKKSREKKRKVAV